MNILLKISVCATIALSGCKDMTSKSQQKEVSIPADDLASGPIDCDSAKSSFASTGVSNPIITCFTTNGEYTAYRFTIAANPSPKPSTTPASDADAFYRPFVMEVCTMSDPTAFPNAKAKLFHYGVVLRQQSKPVDKLTTEPFDTNGVTTVWEQSGKTYDDTVLYKISADAQGSSGNRQGQVVIGPAVKTQRRITCVAPTSSK